MALDTNAKRVPINKVSHSLRASQLIYQYGPGSMVDFPSQTLMTAAPEYWGDQVEKIHDERLEKALHVDFFGLPSSDVEKGNRDGVSYVRFPEWYFCPKCRSFKPMDEWVKQHKASIHGNALKDPDMISKPRCTTCRQPLVAARIVTVCKHGHIDDFPWIGWVHARAHNCRGICANPSLKLKTSSASEGLEGIIVSCANCGAVASLRGAFDKDVFENLTDKLQGAYSFICKGRHPWKHSRESCALYPVAIQRGSSSAYFPHTVSSLVIPPYSSILTGKIQDSQAYAECRRDVNSIREMLKNFGAAMPHEMKTQMLQQKIEEGAYKIALEIGAESSLVEAVLKRQGLNQEDLPEEEASDADYRAEEYDALRGSIVVADNKYDGDFVLEKMDTAAYRLPFIARINLVHKIREVIVLTGFTRIEPVEGSLSQQPKETLVRIKEKETNWYPAYQVRGEGIFIELDTQAVDAWRNANPEVQRRAAVLTENYANSFMGEQHPRKVTSRYLLLHTLSHLLIKQLSFDCGYGIASLKERIYCSETVDGKEMAGIFIYTAGGDSEGTLGGLVRQGRADVFPGIFRKAVESARLCSNDPVCSLSSGQGRDSLNMAACYSCSLIPETCCEDFNAFLDRGVVVGTLKNPEIGFYSGAMNNGWLVDEQTAKRAEITVAVQPETLRTSLLLPNASTGIDMQNVEWRMIWHQLMDYADSEGERVIIQDMGNNEDAFVKKEHPVMNREFSVSDSTEQYEADMMWTKSKVLFFTADNQDAYEAARHTDWKCFISSDTNITAQLLADALSDV